MSKQECVRPLSIHPKMKIEKMKWKKTAEKRKRWNNEALSKTEMNSFRIGYSGVLTDLRDILGASIHELD